MPNIIHTVNEPEHAGKRLDVFVSEVLRLCTRSQIKHRNVVVLKNGKAAAMSKKTELGDVLSITYTDPEPSTLAADPMDFVVLFENEDVLVIDKPQGLVVHPGSGKSRGTLVNGLLARYPDFADAFPDERARPGIVHRLDKDTTGVLIVAKNQTARLMLSAQFQDRHAKKVYLAVVKGIPELRSGVVDTRIVRDRHDRKKFRCSESAGRLAVTHYSVLRSAGRWALVRIAPRTGRTHQIRVHMRHIGHPILGDPIYGGRDPAYPDAPLMLHAWKLTILLPNETEPRTFKARIPSRFRPFMDEVVAEPGDGEKTDSGTEPADVQ